VAANFGISGFKRFSFLLRLIFTEACGAIWLVDSHDRENNFVEVREEFQWMCHEILKKDIPILVLATKQDLPVRFTPIHAPFPTFGSFLNSLGGYFGCRNLEIDEFSWKCEVVGKIQMFRIT